MRYFLIFKGVTDGITENMREDENRDRGIIKEKRGGSPNRRLARRSFYW